MKLFLIFGLLLFMCVGMSEQEEKTDARLRRSSAFSQ
jgi:hypothetical protein